MCVLWWHLWVHNIVGSRTVKHNQEITEVSRERRTAILFGTTLVMAEYALNSSKSAVMYDAFNSSILQVVREERREGAKEFHIAGDLNVELRFMCGDEKDIEELMEKYGPLGGQRGQHSSWMRPEIDVVCMGV